MRNKDQISLKRLSVELERLAGELVRLDGEPPAAEPGPATGRERPADQVRRRLYEARRACGLRQADLADRLGRPQSFVSNYERGTARLEISEFIQIATLLGVDAAAVVAEIASEA